MPKSSRIGLLLIILLAVHLRFPALFSNHFHADEALFASWARLIAIGRDPLLLRQAVDKPPLLFYLQALFYPLSGNVEWAARLPNMVASILTVPLTAVFSWRIYRQSITSMAAALLVAMSPMAIQFSATAFTDPLLTAFLLAALLWTVSVPKPFWAGFIFGLAILTKHQAWLFLPLLGGLAWLNNWKMNQWLRMLAGFLPILILFFLWQVLRQGSLSLLNTQLSNYGGVRMAWSWELLPRLSAWAGLWPLVTGSTLMVLLFLLAILVLFWSGRKEENSAWLFDAVLILFIFAYLALHWLLAVPVWDRYLLPLVPLAAIVTGRGLALISNRFSTDAFQPLATAVLLIMALLLIQTPIALAARSGKYHVGGRWDADQGAWQVADYLERLPYGTVLYDHWFSWHWRYAFIDKGVYTNWFKNPTGLAEDLKVFGERPGDRYLVVPNDDRAQPVLRSVNAAGFSAIPVLQTDVHPGMMLYYLEPS